mmetsp:Transcript_19202/g.45931  ORF Transcript_19202/g.45931 Transcript_19202/m.45931 type:complete len:85 (+) Transcript_19202:1054-1308(+)
MSALTHRSQAWVVAWGFRRFVLKSFGWHCDIAVFPSALKSSDIETVRHRKNKAAEQMGVHSVINENVVDDYSTMHQEILLESTQ